MYPQRCILLYAQRVRRSQVMRVVFVLLWRMVANRRQTVGSLWALFSLCYFLVYTHLFFLSSIANAQNIFILFGYYTD